MVARINTGKSISKALNYNEQKVKNGSAEMLSASGFIRTVDSMNFYDKKHFFESYTSLNQNATTNVLHVSLNFDPSEKLSNEKMIVIANDYMGKIGFGEQPYLVYRHNDSGHPHLHIVSTNIKNTGERISMHRLGANQSESARKEIEVAFNLVIADSKRNMQTSIIVAVNASKVIYGKSEIKRAISNILKVVLNQYKFSSLPELNAVLQLYNVNAERGDKDSRMYGKGGLVYRVLDEKGNKVGTPVKSSLFYMKPTLKMLEQKFKENEKLKEPFKKKLQAKIGWVLHKKTKNLDAFIKALQSEGVSVIVRRGKENLLFGLTYVDHKNQVVFNGSDLGKQYSGKAVMENFKSKPESWPVIKIARYLKFQYDKQLQHEIKGGDWKLGPVLPEASMPYEPIPYSMKIKKRRKKNKHIRF
jgi:hypothetical protein